MSDFFASAVQLQVPIGLENGLCWCNDGERAAIKVLQSLWMIFTRVCLSDEPMSVSEGAVKISCLCGHCTDGTRDASPVISIGRAHRQV